jgi:hypothetical protein
MTPGQRKAAAAAVAAVIATAMLKRSRLARLAVVGGLAAAAYTRLTGREPEWHEVERTP